MKILSDFLFIQTWGKTILMLVFCIIVITIAATMGIGNGIAIWLVGVLIYIGFKIAKTEKQPSLNPTHLVIDEIKEKIIFAGDQIECEDKYKELNDVGYRIVDINEYKQKYTNYEMVDKIVLEREKD